MKTIDSTFALLDVQGDREELTRRVKAGERIPVTITGIITNCWGSDDGTSIGMQVEVVSAAETPAS